MAQSDSANGSMQRFETELTLADARVGDRIAPELVPRSADFDVGDSVAPHHQHRNPEEVDNRTFSVRTVLRAETGQFGHVQSALVYDPEADLFARLSGHTSSGAMSQAERDWKVRDIGVEMSVVDVSDAEIPDLEDFDETPEEFVREWVDTLIGNARYGDDIGAEVQRFDGKSMQLRDYDNRSAWVQYELVAEE